MAKYIVQGFLHVASDFVPETFGRLTTIGPKFLLPVGTQGKYVSYQACQCSCGASDACVVRCCHLASGGIQSCGCHKKEATSIRRKTHGMSKTPEYMIWKTMRQRCNNPGCAGYPDYGGRGVSVCHQWDGSDGFAQFISDMGRRPPECNSINRIDNDGNYEPGNCKWATQEEQCRNQRSNHKLTAFGKTMCISEWAEELGVKYKLISSRIRTGWSVEDALSIPPLKPGQKHRKRPKQR